MTERRMSMNTTSKTPSPTRTARSWLATLAAGAAVGAVAVAAAAVIGGASPSSNAAQAVAVPTTTTAPVVDDENEDYPRTVTVSGHGSVTVKPDIATLSLGVSVTGDTANGALRKAAEKADALIKALEASGVDEDDIVTSDISLYPQYNEDGNKVIGYNASNDLTATVRQIDTTGAVIDAAAGLVGDEISIGGVSFSVDDSSDALSEARQAATADALQHATDLTAGVHAKVGQVLTIDETYSNYQPYYPAYEASDGSAEVSTPIQTGTQDITVDVTVVFEVQ
jgi:uncharacterized protein YggE